MRRILLNTKYEHLRKFVESIPSVMDTEGEYVYGGRRNLIKNFTASDGTVLNVKRYKKPNFVSNIIYSSGIRKPKGLRAYTYPQILLSKNIGTPEAVAYIEDRHCGLLYYSYFISVFCPYTHLLYEMGNACPEVYEPVAKSLARFVSHMHEEGVLHQDFSPGNVLWDRREDMQNASNENCQYYFCIVDINRMKFGNVSMKEGCKSFARLWGPKRFISLLVREYAVLRGFDADKAENITMTERAKFWKKYSKKREIEFNLEL